MRVCKMWSHIWNSKWFGPKSAWVHEEAVHKFMKTVSSLHVVSHIYRPYIDKQLESNCFWLCGRYWLQCCARPHCQLWLFHPLVHLRWHTWRLQPGQFHFGPWRFKDEGIYLCFICFSTEASLHISPCFCFCPLPQIPLLQRAQAMSPRPLSLLGSAWTAPAWMKTNNALTGKGSLKGQAGGKEHKTWAQYYIRWLVQHLPWSDTVVGE